MTPIEDLILVPNGRHWKKSLKDKGSPTVGVKSNDTRKSCRETRESNKISKLDNKIVGKPTTTKINNNTPIPYRGSIRIFMP